MKRETRAWPSLALRLLLCTLLGSLLISLLAGCRSSDSLSVEPESSGQHCSEAVPAASEGSFFAEPDPESDPEPDPEPEPKPSDATSRDSDNDIDIDIDIDIDASEILSLLTEIDALAERHRLSVAYHSGDGAHTYSVNGDEIYPSASTIKAMYCQYLLESNVDWNDVILFDFEADSTSSSGAVTTDALDSRMVDLLLRPTYTPRTASGVEYPVASKYGYQSVAKAYQEATIVFAPEPYVLVVMSRLDPTVKETASVLAELAWLVGQVHSLHAAS